ncbi:hypothetical protein Lser_V15G42761 [Lactuca serriola]
MAHITDLPLHILDVILVAIAMSSDGARDLARVGAVCNMLLTETRQLVVLKVVNFQRLTFTAIDYMMHHHEKDLLCMSARAGNRAARSIVGKALLVNDLWFWGMILLDYQRACCGCIKPFEALDHQSLVRTFILHATSKDIATTCHQLLNYVVSHVGYNVARENGLVSAIFNMCSFETRRLVLCNIGIHETFSSVDCLVVRVQPPYEASYREAVVIAFDKLFTLTCV